MVKGLDTLIDLKTKLLGCIIGRGLPTTRRYLSCFAKSLILKPLYWSTGGLPNLNMHPYIDHLPSACQLKIFGVYRPLRPPSKRSEYNLLQMSLPLSLQASVSWNLAPEHAMTGSGLVITYRTELNFPKIG
jgi:hypothetical protein